MIGKNNAPLRTALIYALFGGLWIVFSDRVLEILVPVISPAYVQLQTIKGWLFVLASASLIYLILQRDAEARRRVYARMAYQAGLIEDVSDALISSDMQFKVVIWNSAARKYISGRLLKSLAAALTPFCRRNIQMKGTQPLLIRN